MKRLPWAKFTIRRTPKMIVSPAEISHRYIASDRPMRPWKAIVSIAREKKGPRSGPLSSKRLLRRRNRREGRIPVVVLGLEHPQVPEHRDGVFLIRHHAPGRNVVDELLILGSEDTNPAGIPDLHSLHGRDDFFGFHAAGLFHGSLHDEQGGIGGLGGVIGEPRPALFEALDESPVVRGVGPVV